MHLTEARDIAFRMHRNQKRYLARAEKKWCETPTSELKNECEFRRGILKGIEHVWTAIETVMDGNEFIFDEEIPHG